MNETIDFGLTAEAFSIDAERRTLTGVVVPWNQIGKHRNGKRWRFVRGGLKYGHEKYIRLNDEHVQSARLGRAVAAEDTDAGLLMTFKVYDGRDGDRALALAGDGTKTGFSVEIEFDEMDAEPDPDNPGVLLVNMANLTGVAFVRNPAFDDARLISVRANEEGTGMPEETQTTETPATPTPPPPASASPAPAPAPAPAQAAVAPAAPVALPELVTFSADQFDALIARMGTAATPAETTDTRPTVDPTTRPVATTQVQEPLPYRFSYEGGRTIFSPAAEHDFSTDLYAVLHAQELGRDATAQISRINGMIQAAFDVDRADTTDSTQPHRYQPELWQPQTDYATPLWEFVNSGSTDGTKFDIPKFNSSSGLVGPATEGTEPAAGAFTVTLQTITPTQVWGKVEVTRQAWRAGGNPQLSGILWDQMLREYYEDRESAVATFLNTLTAAADITLTGTPASSPDNDDDQVTAGDLEAAIALLQFARGGNRFRAFAAHIDLYKVLARVKDDAGRPMFPMLNPQNANGTAANLFGTLNIAGTTVVPSWALGATGTAAANSWLFDPAKVRGWASAPERLFWDFGATVQTANIPQLAHVTIGIYGDVAFGNTDINGVRQVIFDPSV